MLDAFGGVLARGYALSLFVQRHLRFFLALHTGTANLGKLMVKTHPIGAVFLTVRVPLFARTDCCAIVSPRPIPVRSMPPCVNGRNIASAEFGGSPPQWSETSIKMRSADA